ncbi:MAG: GNAT family N-acetyltransferase [Burkholderiaceae bacterium]|nr:GNAT family N-acetyltransferase [Burkholderiaceae bacterium]MBY0455649.1 GNAT family N-acetyltransferase [Burkholderiaceae bacterium]
MKVAINHRCDDFNSYRAARVKSLFNVETGANFQLEANLDLESAPWKIGVIVGPSGSGKTSIGHTLWGKEAVYAPPWPQDQPIIDVITPQSGFDDVTAALSSVGLGSVPTWLRPYSVLSNGEQFRANLARLIAESPDRAVLDEFSSVVDRQIARIGAGAFSKAWRRTSGQAVLLSCHYDILDWVQPDWVFDTATGQFQRGWLRRRPQIDVELWQCGWEHWPAFEAHHYLKLPHMIAATNYVATVNGQLVAHVAVSTRSRTEARACRLVVMPEWQGAGVGLRFLDAVCELWRTGANRYHRPMPTLFHTSHPGLASALRRSARWTQVSAKLIGGNKARSAASIGRSAQRNGRSSASGTGYGGHFRAVQGFRYLGDPKCA